MAGDDDLYGDLDTSISALEKKEAVDQRHKAERESDALRTELALLQTQNRQLAQANQVLEANMSKLFATAQNEIKRKDNEIQRLREALEAHERRGRDRTPHAHHSHASRGGSSSASADRIEHRATSKSPSHACPASAERRA